jgi:hypothetical protein
MAAAVILSREEFRDTQIAELTGLPLRAHSACEVTQAVSDGLTVLEVAPSREAILAKIAAVLGGADPLRYGRPAACEASLCSPSW